MTAAGDIVYVTATVMAPLSHGAFDLRLADGQQLQTSGGNVSTRDEVLDRLRQAYYQEQEAAREREALLTASPPFADTAVAAAATGQDKGDERALTSPAAATPAVPAESAPATPEAPPPSTPEAPEPPPGATGGIMGPIPPDVQISAGDHAGAAEKA